MTPGKIRITKVGAEPTDIELSAGQVLWIPAETHTGMNTGTAEVKLLVIEFKALKDAPMDKAPDKPTGQ